MPIITPSSEAVQGSEKWLALRLGIPTASQFKRFMGNDFDLKEGRKKGTVSEDLLTYCYELCAERYSGSPLNAFTGSWATEQGQLREPQARKWLEFSRDIEIEQVAFVKTDDGKCGCSPDGLIGCDNGLELKCLEPVNHIKTIMGGVLPDEYKHQVYGSMYVTGRPRWTFCAFRQDWPCLVLTVERDEEIMRKIGECIQTFTLILETQYAKLKAIP